MWYEKTNGIFSHRDSGLVGDVDNKKKLQINIKLSAVMKYSRGKLEDEMKVYNMRCDLIP